MPKVTKQCQTCLQEFTNHFINQRYCSWACGGVGRRIAIEERFWAKVRRTDDDTSCWEWTGYRDKQGYGRMKRGRSAVNASRISFELLYGQFDQQLRILHKCDNPPCVRPDHLFAGTNRDNSNDAVIKGRTAKGIGHGHARLTEADVIAIRADTSSDSQRETAQRFNISQTLVSQIRLRKIWRHIK